MKDEWLNRNDCAVLVVAPDEVNAEHERQFVVVVGKQADAWVIEAERMADHLINTQAPLHDEQLARLRIERTIHAVVIVDLSIGATVDGHDPVA